MKTYENEKITIEVDSADVWQPHTMNVESTSNLYDKLVIYNRKKG